MFADGEGIGRSRWLGITIALINLLDQLLVTRHEAEARRMRGEILEAAKQELPEGDYAMVYSSSHDLPDGPRGAAPGTICRKRLGGRPVALMWLAWRQRVEDPESWHTEVLKSARDPKAEIGRRIALISLLGAEAGANDKARRALMERLRRDPLPEIRAAAAEALDEAASAVPAVVRLLLDRLDNDASDAVRAECAEALRRVAPDRAEVRTRLESLFSSGPEVVRAGAARGLSRLDFAVPERQALREQFLTMIASADEPPRVRRASIRAVAPLLGRDDMGPVNRAVEACLDDPDPIVSNAALHAVADAIVEGRRKWSQPLVEKAESRLMAVIDPCPHSLGDLAGIVAMKELRGAHRLERLLGDALAAFGDLVKLAFVFGSVARLEQVRDSDIDLMIVGDVRLKEVAAALHEPEKSLGRPVNPVLYSADKFREQYREGNPFLLEVVRREKIFLKGRPDELTELVADRSPD
jgi:predicted nucleotidyltransferase